MCSSNNKSLIVVLKQYDSIVTSPRTVNALDRTNKTGPSQIVKYNNTCAKVLNTLTLIIYPRLGNVTNYDECFGHNE